MIPIIYEDNHLLVVIKPVNVPTQQDESGDIDLLSLLKEDIKNKYQKPGNVYLGLVHRLDRPAGGVMVFAKTSKSASRLSDQVRTHTMNKHYYAVVRGLPYPSSGTLQHYLVKDTANNIVTTSTAQNKEAKSAILHYKVKGHHENLSLLEIDLITGRSHQIRVQFSSIGCPLYGDQKYGIHVNKPGQQMALWSTMLSFNHPITKELIEFHSAPPTAYPWDLWPELLHST